ncbi:amidohydrolase [Herbiconiux sp.]|uniref:amidohydrolase n=1 Tax=Herbiconiux sp. TaxID=1871186 RepID=UPI0025BE7E68|nr:amidohydrolase [Herbiconiux sp.]
MSAPVLAVRLFTNGRIFTGHPGGERFVECVAASTADGRILALGGEAEVRAAVDAWVQDAGAPDPQIELVDLGGAFAMPGFVDVHNHHALAGRSALFELEVSPTASLDELLDAVRGHASTLGADDWVVGGAWGSTLLDELATRDALRRLDDAAGGRAVMLADDSRHNRWVSSRALALAGIGDDFVPEGGGVALRDPSTGALTGVLLEAAGIPVAEAQARAGGLDAAQHRASSKKGVEMLSGFGVTAFQDAAASLDILAALKGLDDDGELDAWVVSSVLVNDEIFGFSPIGDELIERAEAFRSAHHRPDFVKIFLDGVPPARTGAFLEPYLPDDAHGDHFHGHSTMDPDELYDWLRRTAARGLSAKIHCTGDASARQVLDVVERLRAEGVTARYQIAHGQFVSDADIARFAALDVAADISPFIWFPGVIPDAIAAVLPAGRAERMQPNRALLDSGALVAGGSDWPVSESPNPWEGIERLVTRADPLGRASGTLWPEQAISLEDALAVFTLSAATAMGLGAETGSLAVGKSADLITLDHDPFEVPPTALHTLRVARTYFAARRVH